MRVFESRTGEFTQSFCHVSYRFIERNQNSLESEEYIRVFFGQFDEVLADIMTDLREAVDDLLDVVFDDPAIRRDELPSEI